MIIQFLPYSDYLFVAYDVIGDIHDILDCYAQ